MIVPEGKKNGSVILVEIVGEPVNTLKRLQVERPRDYRYYVDKHITDQKVCVFDTRTKMYTDNSVYEGPKGLYIKKGGRRYLLEDFK